MGQDLLAKGDSYNGNIGAQENPYQGIKFPNTQVKIPCSLERLIEN
jgi:hypothetical protein